MQLYFRLRQELEVCRHSPEEKKCRILKQELERLQRECYKKQMKLLNYHTPHNTTDSIKTSDNSLECENNYTDSDEWELDENELASLEAAEAYHLNNSESDFDEAIKYKDLQLTGCNKKYPGSDRIVPTHSIICKPSSQKYIPQK